MIAASTIQPQLSSTEDQAQLQAIDLPALRSDTSTTPERKTLLSPPELQAALAIFNMADKSFDEKVDLLDAYLRATYNLLDIEVAHYLANGTYTREVIIPAGTLLIGKIHNFEHMCIVSTGSIIVWSEERGHELITGPETYVSSVGARRVGFTLSDTMWTTVDANPTNEQSIEVLEAKLFSLRPPVELPPNLFSLLEEE